MSPDLKLLLFGAAVPSEVRLGDAAGVLHMAWNVLARQYVPETVEARNSGAEQSG